MSVVLICGLPRSSSLGVADLLSRSLDHDSVHMQGHLHMAAALDSQNLSQYDSPFGFYDGSESLLRCLLQLNGIPDNIDTRLSVSKYYFDDKNNCLNHERFLELIDTAKALIIDPSFSHSVETRLLSVPFTFGLKTSLFVVWRNPICFCMDLMEGVYGLDCCLQWILCKQAYSFPLDPIQIWFDCVSSIRRELAQSAPSFANIFYSPLESFSLQCIPTFATSLSLACNQSLKPSIIKDVSSYMHDCPYSGDPSFSLARNYDSTLEVSLKHLSRFSYDSDLISAAAQTAENIGYCIVD